MEQKTINAEVRKETGKNANHRLRNEGYIPTVIYSHGKSEELKIKTKDFRSIFHGHISESVIFGLKVAGHSEDLLAFVKEYQSNPVTGAITHLDLFKVTKGEKIQTHVPVELVGVPVGLKMGGQLETGEREIHVECDPRDLVEKIVVTVTNLNLGDTIHTRDIVLPAGLTLIGNPDGLIASVHELRVAADVVAEPGAEAAIATPEA